LIIPHLGFKNYPEKKLEIEEKSQPQREWQDEKNDILRSQTDPQAFRPLYEKYFKRIFLFVLHRVEDRSVAGDITSQTFLKALLNIGRFKFRGLPFSSWLFRIALNECNDYFRKNSRYRIVTIDDKAVEHLFEELTNNTREEDLRQQLPVILQRLSREELQLIELRFFDQRPFKEVADIIGITETYAKVKVYRILQKMKKLFLKES
jgi:RNA polymerase sigma-70 factor (ECF subfamily)